MKLSQRLLQFFSFPVLRRELTQQAAKKRNYVLRVVYAAIAFMLGSLVLADLLVGGFDRVPFSSLGRGAVVFDRLLFTQFVFVYLFLPAYCSGLITSEKERSTLQLLLLSKLRPTSIIVEKLFSRLVPFVTIVVMVAPLMGVAYALGGIEQRFVWNSVYLLLLAAIQTAVIAIACSSWCMKSTHAFVATYVVGALFFYLVPVVFLRFCGYPLGYTDQTPEGVSFLGLEFKPHAVFLHCAIFHYADIGRHKTVYDAVMTSGPVIVTTAGWFIAARFWLIRRATPRRAPLLPRILSAIDAILCQLTDGRIGSKTEMPDDTPIAWMETKRGILGNPRHQIYLVSFIEVCVLIWIGYLIGTSSTTYCPRELMDGMLLLFALVTLIICSRSVSIFSADYAGQTLPTLLASPLTNREIIGQKYLGLRNLIAFLLIPCLTFVVFFEIHAHEAGQIVRSPFTDPWANYSAYGSFTTFDSLRFGIVMLSSLVIYTQMIAWLGINVGMFFKRRSVALFVLLTLLVAWFVLPVMILTPIFEHYQITRAAEITSILFLSPAVVPATSMFGTAIGGFPWSQAFVNISWHIACWLSLRWLAHYQFAKRYGRTDVGETTMNLAFRQPMEFAITPQP